MSNLSEPLVTSREAWTVSWFRLVFPIMKTILLLALAAVFSIITASAEVLIYDLSFNTSGPSVNYSFLQGGYLVVDAGSNAVSSIVTQTDPTTDLLYYTTGVLSGTYMELASEGSNQEYAVINSTSGSGGTADTVAFQILGKTSDQVDIGDGNSLSIARKLQGYLIASAAESVSTDTNNVTTITYGFAGTSKVAAKYQSGLTKEANDKRLDSSTAINLLTEVLKNRGVVAQPTASPSPSATATATATATPTATATATATP